MPWIFCIRFLLFTLNDLYHSVLTTFENYNFKNQLNHEKLWKVLKSIWNRFDDEFRNRSFLAYFFLLRAVTVYHNFLHAFRFLCIMLLILTDLSLQWCVLKYLVCLYEKIWIFAQRLNFGSAARKKALNWPFNFSFLTIERSFWSIQAIWVRTEHLVF